MRLFGRSTRKDDAKAEAYRDWVTRRNPLAIVSLVLGVFSLIELGALIVPGVASIILGVLALRQLRQGGISSGQMHGHRLAIVGISLSAISLAIAAVLYTHAWRR